MRVSDFYDDWTETDFSGPRPDTIEAKVEHGVQWYSGDSGVSDEELEAYLRDLVAQARREPDRDALAGALARMVSDDETVFVGLYDENDEPEGDVYVASTTFADLLVKEMGQ